MNKTITTIVIILLVIAGAWYVYQNQTTTGEAIKVGVITDLTGPASYWGESTRAGAILAAQELKSEGVNVDLVFEDYQLEASKAVSAAQKLLSVDKVDALYVEFNPGAVAVSSIAKTANKLMVYDAAITSPLKDSPYFYKTYLDYQKGCKLVAQGFKDKSISKIGVLKINLEAGDLCLEGVKEVFTDSNLVVDSYNLGDTDFRTQLLKLNQAGVQAVINVGFEGDTYNALKVFKERGYRMLYGTVDDTISEKVLTDFNDVLEGSLAFGFKDVDSNLVSKLQGANLSLYYGAAIAYTHIKQIGLVTSKCGQEINCIKIEMAKLKSDNSIGFNKFNGQTADLEMVVKER